jgi:hypothetical protein
MRFDRAFAFVMRVTRLPARLIALLLTTSATPARIQLFDS